MATPRVKAKKSKIHGMGLFADQRIRKGTVIGRCEVRRTRKPGDYTLWLDEETGFDVVCNLRFINHSKKPNVAYYDDFEVVALKNIRAGEELVHDYGET
ncbi:MAG: SET domain-containing protein, partial [Verrucomicrobiota bacterium]